MQNKLEKQAATGLSQIYESRIQRLEQQIRELKIRYETELAEKNKLSGELRKTNDNRKTLEKSISDLKSEITKYKDASSKFESQIQNERKKAQEAVNQVQQNTGNLKVLTKSLEAERYKASRDANQQREKAQQAMALVQDEAIKAKEASEKAVAAAEAAEVEKKRAEILAKQAQEEKKKVAIAASNEKKQAERLRLKVNQILQIVAKAAQGDLTQRLKTNETDAIAEVMKGLSKLFETIQSSLLQIQSQSNEVVGSSNTLLDISSKMKETATTSSQRIALVSETSKDINDKIKSVEITIQEMSGGISKISEATTNASKFATKAVEGANETAKVISELGNSFQDIRSVANFINSIVRKTKMLSINARIEAATAGKFGAGFRVVADEISAMATETSEATSKIEKTINDLLSEVKKGATSMTEINQVIGEMKNVSDSVANTVENYKKYSDGIANDILTVIGGTRTIHQSIEQITQAAKDSAVAAEDTQRQAQSLNEISTEQNRNLAKFKLK